MDDDDDPEMESSFARQQREEYISKKIGKQPHIIIIPYFFADNYQFILISRNLKCIITDVIYRYYGGFGRYEDGGDGKEKSQEKRRTTH